VEFKGHVSAIDSIIDQSTRNVQVQATFANHEHKLRPGMFVEAKLALGGRESAVTVPASAINYAPYGDSVFVVTDIKDPKGQSYRGVQQHFVKLGATRGDQIAVLSGINSGDEVVTSGTFKLRNGAAVQTNNSVQPADSPAPHVEDR
jgi:membrane fusion protein (multidrug efflux system)